MANEASFALQPATRDDIARMAEVNVTSSMNGNASEWYFPTPAEFNRSIVGLLEGRIGDPAWLYVKVVDSATGTLAAWASFHTPPDDQLRFEAARADAASGEGELGSKGDLKLPPGIGAHVKAAGDRFFAHATLRRRHIKCRGLFTDPRFERRGMASALMRHGNEFADAAGLPIFVQTSALSFPIFERYGFHTIGHLDVDLRDWAPGAKRDDMGYGMYRFRNMVRLPETLPKGE